MDAITSILSGGAFTRQQADALRLLAAVRPAPRVKTISGTETAVDMTGFDVLVLSQSAPTTILSFAGAPHQQFVAIASNANTTFDSSAAVNLVGGVAYNVAAGRAVGFIFDASGAVASEIGT